jgi:cyclohexanone monooxygenase
MSQIQAPADTSATVEQFDAIVIGAGFAGLRMLYELRELGLSVRVIETAADVGGTWYWNQYPDARTDSESWVYAFSFSRELQDEWDWTERFPSQPETHAYLRHVADRFDLRRDIELNTTVQAAAYDEDTHSWNVTTDRGSAYRCTYLVPAVGLLSAPYQPDFPGHEKFAGDSYLTGRWPRDPVIFEGKRVAIIGTGSTGVQIIPVVAKTAKHLTVFQRTPNYVLPARNYAITEFERSEVRSKYDQVWEQAKDHFFGMAMKPPGRKAVELSPEERERVLEAGWEAGGFRFIFETFDDLLVDEKANAVAAEFVRNKIRAIVNDPETAELLCPKDYPLAGKRPPLGHFYYEAYNRDNVSLIDVRNAPIREITKTAVRTAAGDYPCDMIIYATGFDAGTGTLKNIDIRGRGGVSLAQRWKSGPETYLGICVDDFPNMFMISGPQSPFANAPVVIDGIVEWIGTALKYLRERSIVAMEPASGAVEKWCQRMDDLVSATLLTQGRNAWFLGANIPGKPRVVLFYFGGAGAYRQECTQVAADEFHGFVMSRAL